MKEDQQVLSTGEPEETLVTPRFDEVETVQAQPVVPLADVPAGAHFGSRFGSRRGSLPLALVLVSALVGSVVGGAGLYLYQRGATEKAASAEQPAAPAEAPQPAAAEGAPEETASLPPQTTEPAAEADAANAGGAETAELPAASHEEPDAVKKREADRAEAEKAPAPEPRKVVEREDDDGGAFKRGKKGEPVERREPRAERVGSREEARGDDYREGEARLADEIIYRRERRAERRAERRERRANRQRSVDRVRGIFEGQPE